MWPWVCRFGQEVPTFFAGHLPTPGGGVGGYRCLWLSKYITACQIKPRKQNLRAGVNTREPPVAASKGRLQERQWPSGVSVPRPRLHKPRCSDSKSSRIPRQEVPKTLPNNHSPTPQKSFSKMFSLLEGKTCPCLKQLDLGKPPPTWSEPWISGKKIPTPHPACSLGRDRRFLKLTVSPPWSLKEQKLAVRLQCRLDWGSVVSVCGWAPRRATIGSDEEGA